MISNTDRHLNNFGIIRDADTLKPIKMAPIYDNGNSMFWDQISVKYNPKALDKLETCSFNKREIKLLGYVTDFHLFDTTKLPSEDEIYDIYKKDASITEDRIREMIKCMHYKAERIKKNQ